jgi:hypothetical protein
MTESTLGDRSAEHKLVKLGKRVFAILALIAGVLILMSFWAAFYEFAQNRSLGHGWSSEIAFWDGLPAIEAGILIGLLCTAICYQVRGLLIALLMVVWIENVLNLFIFVSLVSSGVLF